MIYEFKFNKNQMIFKKNKSEASNLKYKKKN
jgi:hypothetical protein